MPYLLLFFDYLDKIVVGFGVFGLAIYLIRNPHGEHELRDLLPRLFAYGTIPMGVAFIVCAFDPTLLSRLASINIYIAAAGCSILYVAWDALR